MPHLQGALHPPAHPAVPAQRLPQVRPRAADDEPRGLLRCRLRVLHAGQPQVQGAVPLHGEAGQAGEIRWVLVRGEGTKNACFFQFFSLQIN